jgi:hypothetical protein
MKKRYVRYEPHVRYEPRLTNRAATADRTG